MAILKMSNGNGGWAVVEARDPGALRIDKVQNLNEEQTSNLKQTLDDAGIVGGVGVDGESVFSVNFNNTDTNVSGGKVFKIVSIDENTGALTLDSVEGIQPLREKLESENYENSVDKDGLYASVKLFYNYSHIGKITNVNLDENTIEIENIKDILKEIDYSITGTLDNGEEYDITDKRFLWFPYHPELGTDLSYSSCTFATGANNIAYASNAFATGIRNVAGSSFSTVFGRDNFSGYTDVTEGYGNKNYGTYSHIEGERNSLTCTSEGTHIEGAGNIVDGSHKHVEGTNNISEGNESSHTEGNGNTNPAELSHVEGQLNNINKGATGSHTEGKSNIVRQWASWSHTEGVNNIVDGYASHIEGTDNTVLESRGHAEGQNNTIAAGATCGHVEGLNNQVIGKNAHAQGTKTSAVGMNSFAGGEGTVADGKNSTALGQYNVGYGDSLLEIGMGTSETGRKNAFTVHSDGRATVAIGPTGDMDVTTKLYVDHSIEDVHTSITNSITTDSLNATTLSRGEEAGWYDVSGNSVIKQTTGNFTCTKLTTPIKFRNISFRNGTSGLKRVIVQKGSTLKAYTTENTSFCVDIADADVVYINFFGATYNSDYTLSYDKRPYQEGFIEFSVVVNQSMAQFNNNAPELIDGQTTDNVDCVIKLPTSYKPYGKKTKLLMICHGAGKGVIGNNVKDSDGNVWTTYEHYINLTNTFVDAGYAVFDCNGYQNTSYGVNFWGAPRGVEAWRKAYDYIIQNYNVEESVSIFGFSMGGLTALNLVMNGFPNVKCIALGSPVLSLEKCYNDNKTLVKAAYGMGDNYEAYKAVGHDPISRIVTMNNKNYCFTNMPPIKVWFGGAEPEDNGADDPLSKKVSPVSISDARNFINALTNSGSYALFREVSGQTHQICFGAVDYVNTEYLYWINRFNGK